MSAGRNELGDACSPYLRQHSGNPVHWRRWGARAFAEAEARGVPVFVSVGYSACHWCHVMAAESFADAEVASALNAGFVSVKVDREERPDVDAALMAFVQATGAGGWPMSVFATPAGVPFFGGTYFARTAFLELLGIIGREYASGLFDGADTQVGGQKARGGDERGADRACAGGRAAPRRRGCVVASGCAWPARPGACGNCAGGRIRRPGAWRGWRNECWLESFVRVYS